MKKIILIIGQQGSGKTSKMNNILAEWNKPFVIYTFSKFQLSIKSVIKQNSKVIAIEEVCSIEQLDYIINVLNNYPMEIIVTSSLSINELSEDKKLNIEIVKL